MFSKPVVELMFTATDDYACISVNCVCCGEGYMFGVSESGYQAWLAGEKVNVAFPELAPEWREMLISGLCPAYWDIMIGEGEE